MSNNEPEYKIVKCETCGHERQGPRIVRLSEQHKKELGKIQKEWHRYITLRLAILLFLMTLGVALAGILSAHDHVLLGFVLGVAMPLTWAYFLMFHWRDKRLGQVIQKETEILAQYGAKREESFEIAE